jgi:hypothetical protein
VYRRDFYNANFSSAAEPSLANPTYNLLPLLFICLAQVNRQLHT